MKDECEELLRNLARSAGVVSQSLNSGDYTPEFRYKNMEKDIRLAKDYLVKIKR